LGDYLGIGNKGGPGEMIKDSIKLSSKWLCWYLGQSDWLL
jgi:hypothetical protein